MKLFRSVSLIINYKTFIITALSVLSTYFCFTYKLTADFPDMLVGIAIVFPVVFSIGSAFNRRESALRHLSDFHGHAVIMFYASRDWTTIKNDIPDRLKMQIYELLEKIRVLFHSKDASEFEAREVEVYAGFSELSKLTIELRELGMPSGEISRFNQYISKLIIAYDNMRVIYQYRTPITLRAYSKTFIYLFPIVYGPYFADTFHHYASHLEYVMPVMYSFILVSLDNIQDHLEHPYDEIGEDDVIIDARKTIRLLK